MNGRTFPGSSPRLRGTVVRYRLAPMFRRFIPAPAGNSPSAIERSERWTVHPRACGEQVALLHFLKIHRGSSPRLRGTVVFFGRVRLAFRFIPAPAGNSCQTMKSSSSMSVHPRACGEQIVCRVYQLVDYGSSPRLRGTATGHGDQSLVCRFIPAPAGNSRKEVFAQADGAVHPRACGEQVRRDPPACLAAGSSPRLRGTD